MQLNEIATQMRTTLLTVNKGYIHRILFGGLNVVLERRDRQWRLAIARTTAPPSRTEADVIARDFAVPAGVEWNWTQKEKRKTIRGSRSVSVYKERFHVAECTWLEEEACPQATSSSF